jgi:ribosomal protein S18 acetylase RimI-like enzyme
VLSDSFAAYEPMYTPGAFAATTPSASVIEQRFGEGPIWVAERQGTIVGTASAVPKGTGLYVRSVAVLPSARGRQVGQALMRQVEDYAAAEHLRRMFLSTTPFLTGAIRLYERIGFQRSGEGPHELHGTPLVTMVKELANLASTALPAGSCHTSQTPPRSSAGRPRCG